MIKRIIKAAALAAAFAATAVIGYNMINRGTDDKVISMGGATLPEVSFMMGTEEVNPLFGYVNDMDINAMRDTITPLEGDGTLRMQVKQGSGEVETASYYVYALGETEAKISGQAEVTGTDGSYRMSLAGGLEPSEREAVLKVVLSVAEKDGSRRDVSFFTRITRPEMTTAKDCLAFAKSFHEKALAKSGAEEIEPYLEPGTQSDNTSYRTVNIHSDVEHIQWGDYSPRTVGEVRWSVKESNTVYSSLLAKYQVSCQNEEGTFSLYNVSEFFRVRIAGSRVFLLDYSREMGEVFGGDSAAFTEKGIRVGTASADMPLEVSGDGSLVAFVQERNLWLVDRKSEEITQVFSFSGGQEEDSRTINDQHEIRIISMDEEGTLAFAVYGYMNRGDHEGEVGAGVYYYDAKRNLIQEKGFITSGKSFAIAKDELGKMVYYNHGNETIYMLAGGTLYQEDLMEGRQTKLAENLEDGQYAVSGDGHIVAYQTGGDKYAAQEIRVMDLRKGTEYTISAGDSEAVLPLGFVHSDFIYGKISVSDKGMMATGEEVYPIYEVDFRGEDGATVANYSFTDQNMYITDVYAEGNVVTLGRATKDGEIYHMASPEYITNNKERAAAKAQVKEYSAGSYGKQVRIEFEDGSVIGSAHLLRPNQLMSDSRLDIVLKEDSDGIKYYVYGMGELKGIYDKAGYAIQKAESLSGVVISSRQAYVWEKGNRDLVYSTGAQPFKANAGEASLQACERYMEQYEAQKADLTGCTLEQALYVINRGCPVIALLDGDKAVLLVSYTKTDVTYINPQSGTLSTVGLGEMKKKMESNGNTYIGYIR